MSLKIQLLDAVAHHELAKWPTEQHTVDLRYSDLPAHVAMTVPTMAGAAGMKTAAWIDRHAPRDLYDLAALARQGALTAPVATLVKQINGWDVTPYVFDTLPAIGLVRPALSPDPRTTRSPRLPHRSARSISSDTRLACANGPLRLTQAHT